MERTLLRLGVRPSDVADATQEVFLVVHRKLPEFEGRAKLSTWLYRITLRVAAAQRRLARHRRELASDALPHELASDHDVQAELEKRALLEQLSRAVDELSEPQRDVLALHELEELRMHDVAQRLGIPRKTAFSRMYAARRALATELRRLGYAVPLWVPLWPSKGWLATLCARSAPATLSKLSVSKHVTWAQAKVPLCLALCSAFAAPTPSRSVVVLSAAQPQPVAGAKSVPLANAVARAAVPPGAAPEVSRTPVVRPRQTRTAHARPSVAPALAVPSEVEAELQVVRMGSEDLRPVVEHPFASRVAVPTAKLPPLTARLAPAAFEPEY